MIALLKTMFLYLFTPTPPLLYTQIPSYVGYTVANVYREWKRAEVCREKMNVEDNRLLWLINIV